uniref:Uncharacterized protein n=1 Tax=viral metagenome TaxID=1070528 RepID=A0A6C0DQ74_9ZZZZ
MDNNHHCDDLLENIKICLCYYSSNSSTNNFGSGSGIFYPVKCENIIRFEQSLEANKTTIQYKQPFLNLEKTYRINYDAATRHISIEQ